MTKGRNKIHTITECGLFSALICVFSPFVVPIGAVPVTLSLFAVFLTGCVLPAKKAVLAVCIYILLGAAGVPVFAGFQGGLNPLLNISGGFIWSYIPVAAVVSQSRGRSFFKRLLLSFFALIICYTLGCGQYMLVSGTKSVAGAVMLCVAPFVVFDAIKAAVACILGNKIRTVLKKQNLL